MSGREAPSELRCGSCGGDRFVECVDRHGAHYLGCVRCVLIPDPRPILSAEKIHAVAARLDANLSVLHELVGAEWCALVGYCLGECYATRVLHSCVELRPPRKPRRRTAKKAKVVRAQLQAIRAPQYEPVPPAVQRAAERTALARAIAEEDDGPAVPAEDREPPVEREKINHRVKLSTAAGVYCPATADHVCRRAQVRSRSTRVHYLAGGDTVLCGRAVEMTPNYRVDAITFASEPNRCGNCAAKLRPPRTDSLRSKNERRSAAARLPKGPGR